MSTPAGHQGSDLLLVTGDHLVERHVAMPGVVDVGAHGRASCSSGRCSRRRTGAGSGRDSNNRQPRAGRWRRRHVHFDDVVLTSPCSVIETGLVLNVSVSMMSAPASR